MPDGWERFFYDVLPCLPAEAAKWSAALARIRARLPTPATFGAKGVGAFHVRPDRLTFSDQGYPDLDEMDFFPLDRDGQRGWVGADRRLALFLVHAVLGGPSLSIIRPLGRTERGAMVAILLSALDQLRVSQAIVVGLGSFSARPEPAPNRLVIECSVCTSAGIGGRATLILPVEWLPEASGLVLGPMEKIRFQATLELARTNLPRSAISAAVLGDAVVFDEIPSFELDGPWPAILRVGIFAAPARLAPDDAFTLSGSFAQVKEDSYTMAIAQDNPQCSPIEPSSSVGDLVATAPVEVVAEIGRLTLRYDEVVGLMKGSVMSLGPRRNEAIELWVGGQLWATGELVNIGDQIGVRILKLREG